MRIMTRTNILKILPIIPLVIIRNVDMLLWEEARDMPVAELFLQNMFSGSPNRKETHFVLVMFGLVEIILFNLLFGMYIYHDLYENTVYIFTRQSNRISWLFNRAMGLLAYCAIWTILFVGLTFGLSAIRSGQGVDLMAGKIFVLTWVLVLLFTYWSTILINLLAIRFGNTIGFLIYYVGLTIASMAAIAHEKIPVIKKLPLLLKLNPVANVTINWNMGMKELWFPVLYFLLLIAVSLRIGSTYIAKMDITLQNSENIN